MQVTNNQLSLLVAIPRIAGWLAHWKESLEDNESKIWRPRQAYTGPPVRSYIPMESREKNGDTTFMVAVSYAFYEKLCL